MKLEPIEEEIMEQDEEVESEKKRAEEISEEQEIMDLEALIKAERERIDKEKN